MIDDWVTRKEMIPSIESAIKRNESIYILELLRVNPKILNGLEEGNIIYLKDLLRTTPRWVIINCKVYYPGIKVLKKALNKFNKITDELEEQYLLKLYHGNRKFLR